MSEQLKTMFTSDGRKVVVVGNLNSQEKIVQEVFVAGNSEIPSGEHFVVKSLHDAPAISWKEKELKSIEERYEKDKKHYEREIDVLKKRYRKESQELAEKIKYIGSALKNADEKSFETLVDYITGEVKWIVVNDYDVELLPIEKFNQMYEDRLRLVSFFGQDNGTFTYAIGDYYDYSGGNKKFIPFKSYEDAVECFKRLLIQKGVSEKSLALAKEFGFEFPENQIQEWKQMQIDMYSRNINEYNSKVSAWQSSIDKLQGN